MSKDDLIALATEQGNRIRELEKAAQEARAKALEDAAQVAEDYDGPGMAFDEGDDPGGWAPQAISGVASRIRALAAKDATKKGAGDE